MASDSAGPRRCAIYTRKSADERADGQLGSTERQRELCEAFVASQAGEGWVLSPERYDDPGHSGGTLKRPALMRLLSAVERREVDMLVVYKIDRLTRSLRDFVGLVEMFEQRGVGFVAITQSFDTRTSMGRLTLNILLSFAQFERELTSERLKDWFAGARARGLWQGPAPYGYAARKGVLSVHEEHASMVRYLFRRYAAVGSCQQLADEANRQGALNQRGRPFDYSFVRRVLRSRVYLGELPHRGTYLPGVHPPLVTLQAWRRVQALMDESVRRCRPKLRLPPEAPLQRLLYDRNGARMVHLASFRRGKAHRYYVPSRRRYGPGTSPDDRFRAGELEGAVLALVERIGCTPKQDDRPGALSGALRRLIARIDMADEHMTITLVTGASFDAPLAGRVAPTERTKGRSGVPSGYEA